MNACTDRLDALLAERASAPRPPPGAPLGAEEAALDAHLAGCARCRAALAAYEAAFDLARAVPVAERPELPARGLALDLGPLLRADPARGWRRATWALSGGLLATAAAAALLVTSPGLRPHRGPAVAAAASAAYQPGVDEAVSAAAAYRGTATGAASAATATAVATSGGDADEVATALLEAYEDADLY